MKEKIKSILGHLMKQDGVGIKSYKENPDGSFELEKGSPPLPV
jgi:hypothetical protein